MCVYIHVCACERVHVCVHASVCGRVRVYMDVYILMCVCPWHWSEANLLDCSSIPFSFESWSLLCYHCVLQVSCPATVSGFFTSSQDSESGSCGKNF